MFIYAALSECPRCGRRAGMKLDPEMPSAEALSLFARLRRKAPQSTRSGVLRPSPFLWRRARPRDADVCVCALGLPEGGAESLSR